MKTTIILLVLQLLAIDFSQWLAVLQGFDLACLALSLMINRR
jgi:hypothetical protein